MALKIYLNENKHYRNKIKKVKGIIIFILLALAFSGLSLKAQEELPIPNYHNAVIVSIEHSPLDSAEVDYIKNRFNFGLYAWLSFSITALHPNLPWRHDWNDASNGLQEFKNQVEALIAAAKAKKVRLHLVFCSGIARGLWVYREAKMEDIRNCSWYNDNKLCSDDQITDPNFMDKYVFGTLSRYARKMRANLEAKAKAMASFLKQKMDENPDILIALSGWGEVEMNYHRIVHTKNLQDYFCDYSPFAVLEFRDWICHTGMYDNVNGKYKGQGYPQGGAKYQGAEGLARFNADFGTNFTTWDLKYFNWSLSDDYDNDPTDTINNDPRRIPLSNYSHGNMMPSSGPNYIPGGFDPPRSMMTPSKFLDLWNLFRQTMVHNFVKDLARWMNEAGIPAERWYSHQIPADYLWGSNPETWPELYNRYYTSASPLWTADIRPLGRIGATIYDIKYPPGVFPGDFARTTKYAVPKIASMTDNWAIMEYDAETYPPGMNVAQSDPDFIVDQFLNIYRNRVHLINFWRWWDDNKEHRIKGMNKEIALAKFIDKIRDKARNPDLSKVFKPPKVVEVKGSYEPGPHKINITLSGKIWSGHPWMWKDWGDFAHFEIYRAETANFIPSSQNLLTKTANYIFEDTSIVMGKTYYYKIRAVNKINVAGPFSDEISVPVYYAAAPKLVLSKKKLYFGAVVGGSATSKERVLVYNGGQGSLNWQVSENLAWLEASPTSYSGNGILEVSIKNSGLAVGDYQGTIVVSDPRAFDSPQTIEVYLKVYGAGSDSPPFGFIDTPLAGSTVFGSVPVTGWALDDVEVKKVEIKRAPHALDPAQVIGSDGLVYIGDAVFVKGARPDVESIYSNFPKADRAGWGYMLLTNFLPQQGNGPFRLYAIAEDSSGRRVQLGYKDIIGDNASSIYPFGTIDTPPQGGIVSGNAYVNFGWALTPQPKEIPRDGSTIRVWVDGQPLGHPVYNQYRVDIATLFPGYKNSNGAVGYYYLDTTKFANGVHTIAWSVTDDAGVTSGIGSRYFEIENLGGSSSFALGCPEWLVEDYTGKLKIKIKDHWKDEIELKAEEVSLIKLQLEGEGNGKFIGWGKERSEPLPIGASLDEKTGLFSWWPGPGFLGRYELHFALTDGFYMSRPVKAIITILPRRFSSNLKNYKIK
ncbi:MAG: hypothetical protein N3B16_04970 [Candidatus Aminicenantes bacterium]|nr:hypothetical protein [Candidatus Aminicenantes bacterium]